MWFNMKIAILQCDNVMEKFQEDFGNYPEMITDLLNSVENNLEIGTFDVQKGEYPQNINDWELFITTGSKASVNDNEDWILDLIEFTKLLGVTKKKLMGICFGHQIIALARGGSVEESDKGWGIGIESNNILIQTDWMDNDQHELKLIVSHKEQINQLPQGAMVIAESDFCPYFMVQWDDHFLSVQGHPEWNKLYSKTLMNDRRSIIPVKRIEQGLASLEKNINNQQFARWIINFAKRKA
ncbi:MAG: GMP synthase-like glutamine amidotransferase [Colwellia sp.]|jgi:GMP synthase-like glutamine amidotransferase